MLLQALSLFIAVAQAGVISGGGGGGFVCRDGENVTKTVLLDFWEARKTMGLTIVDDATPIATQFKKANERLAKIDSALAADVAKSYAYIKTHTVMGGDEVTIPPPKDAKVEIFDKNCPLEGMMYFDDRRKNLVIKKNVFEMLGSNTETAAAYFHEALYKTMRDNHLEGGSDSVLTRIMVGCLFAEKHLAACLGLQEISLPADHKVWQCEIPSGPREPGMKFAAYVDDSYEWNVIPARLGSAQFGFEMRGILERQPVTLPGNEPVHKLRFEPITGLELLGLPWNSKKPPFGSDYFRIVSENPLTLERLESGTAYTCR